MGGICRICGNSGQDQIRKKPQSNPNVVEPKRDNEEINAAQLKSDRKEIINIDRPALEIRPALADGNSEEIIDADKLAYTNTCPAGHLLKWYTDITFYYYTISKSWNIYCFRCDACYSKPGWHCRECKKDLCERCALGPDPSNPILVKPKLVCTKNHELEWSPDTCAYYEEFLNIDYSFRCRGCGETKQEPSWNCRSCCFDICIKCGRDQGFFPPQDLLVCPDNKTLNFQEIKLPENALCKICSINITDFYYTCPDCLYSICEKCAGQKFSLMVQHPGIRCTYHGIILAFVDIKLQRKTFDILAICRGCNKIDMKYGYYCAQCNESYCLKCGHDLAHYIRDSVGKKCAKGHFIYWSFNPIYASGIFECYYCQKSFMSGLFYCEECKINICLNDINSLN